MKRFGGFALWIWVLLGVLGLATVFLLAGRNEMEANPSADSYLPSGTRAFRELLQQSGYRVIVDREPKPKIDPGEAALIYTYVPPPSPTSPFGDLGQDAEPENPPKATPVQTALRQHVERGGTVIELPYARDFIGDTRENAEPIALRRPGTDRSYQGSFRTAPDTRTDTTTESWIPIFANDSLLASSTAKVGRGRQMMIHNGIATTNRFLGRHDNADILIESIRAVLPEGRTIRILEGELAPINRGFFATIGTWALAGWYQSLLLAVVIAWTLGKRLGLPIKDFGSQRGTRELLDGIADTLARRKRTNIAMEYALERNARKLRNHLRLPASVALPDLLRPLPNGLKNAFVQCEVLSKSEKIGETEAIKAIKSLETEVSAFIGEHRRKR